MPSVASDQCAGNVPVASYFFFGRFFGGVRLPGSGSSFEGFAAAFLLDVGSVAGAGLDFNFGACGGGNFFAIISSADSTLGRSEAKAGDTAPLAFRGVEPTTRPTGGGSM